ncbi:MAG: hypothetical protein QMD92_02940 [bacterium]|nr:hypothetical protein [bacterium]
MKQEQLSKEEDCFKKLLFLSRKKSKNLICKDINDLLPIIKEEEELIEKIVASKDAMALNKDNKNFNSIVLELKDINQKNKELVVRSLFFLEDCFKFFASFEDKCTYGKRRQDKSMLFNQVT